MFYAFCEKNISDTRSLDLFVDALLSLFDLPPSRVTPIQFAVSLSSSRCFTRGSYLFLEVSRVQVMTKKIQSYFFFLSCSRLHYKGEIIIYVVYGFFRFHLNTHHITDSMALNRMQQKSCTMHTHLYPSI